mgnify:CR=1 FL=1
MSCSLGKWLPKVRLARSVINAEVFWYFVCCFYWDVKHLIGYISSPVMLDMPSAPLPVVLDKVAQSMGLEIDHHSVQLPNHQVAAFKVLQ